MVQALLKNYVLKYHGSPVKANSDATAEDRLPDEELLSETK